MSAAVTRPVMREHTPARSHDLVSEPAWRWPIDITRYNRTPTLAPAEAEALAVLAEHMREWRQPPARRGVWRVLHRLVRPLADVRTRVSTPGPHCRRSADTAVAVLLRACAVEQSPYWAWSSATWVRILGATQAAFHTAHPPWVDRQVRHYLIAFAYLLDCFTDLLPLGNYKRLALAEKIFGPPRIRAAVDRLATVLCGWGYQNAQKGRAFPRVLCEVLLVNRSPRLSDLSSAVLDRLRATAYQEKHTHLFQLQRALAALGFMDAPDAPVVARPSVQGVSATWIAWAHRWE